VWLPFRAWRRHSRRVARERLAGGLLALHEGRWARAEKLLMRAASDSALRLPALLSALRAADARGDDERVGLLRQQIAAHGNHGALAVFDAERALRADRPHEALAALSRLGGESALPPRGIELRMRALAMSDRAQDALPLLASLRQSQMLEGSALDRFEADIVAASLQQAHDADELSRRWDRLSRSHRSHATVVGAYAARAAQLGLEDQAAIAIEAALKRHWDERLPWSYALLPRGQRKSPLKPAERWLEAHPDSPALLLALGRLCREEQLWGKTEDYLHRALAQGAGAEAWEELGRSYAEQNDEARARHAYANALRMQRSEAALAMPGRGLRELIRDEAVAEERNPMGMPRLRAGSAESGTSDR
jgi:HemY protein